MASKARISDRNARERHYRLCAIPDAQELLRRPVESARAALAEAKAILADVERPSASYTVGGAWQPGLRGAAVKPSFGPALALVEALAAFVGEK